MSFRIGTSSQFCDPEVESSEDTENGSHTQHIVEVSDNIIRRYFFSSHLEDRTLSSQNYRTQSYFEDRV